MKNINRKKLMQFIIDTSIEDDMDKFAVDYLVFVTRELILMNGGTLLGTMSDKQLVSMFIAIMQMSYALIKAEEDGVNISEKLSSATTIEEFFGIAGGKNE